MLPRASQFVNMLKNLERNIFHMFGYGYPPRGKRICAVKFNNIYCTNYLRYICQFQNSLWLMYIRIEYRLRKQNFL